MLRPLLLVFNFSKVLEDIDSEMSHEKTGNSVNYWGGLLSMGGLLSEVSGQALLNSVPPNVKHIPSFAKVWGTRLLVGGAAVGGGVAVVMGIMDIKKGDDEEAKGNIGLANLYFVSGVVGGLAGIGMFLAALFNVPLIGWLILLGLVIASIVISMGIEKLKDNKIQEWINRCYFGYGPDKYDNADIELYNLKHAV